MQPNLLLSQVALAKSTVSLPFEWLTFLSLLDGSNVSTNASSLD